MSEPEAKLRESGRRRVARERESVVRDSSDEPLRASGDAPRR
jgi:hypothetical protein